MGRTRQETSTEDNSLRPSSADIRRRRVRQRSTTCASTGTDEVIITPGARAAAEESNVETNENSVPSNLAAAIDLSLQTGEDQPGDDSILPTNGDAEADDSHLQQPPQSVDNSPTTSAHDDGDFTITEAETDRHGNIITSPVIPPTSFSQDQPMSH